MSMKALNVAQIIVFGPLLAPAATYCFWKHGRSGFLGWVAVVSFCTVRALGAALMYHDEVKEQVSLSSTIVSNLGITPLLMASAGLLHESGWNFTSSATGSRRRMRFFIKALAILSFHVLVLIGIFLILKHATALKDVLVLGRVPANEHSDLSTAKIGFGVLVFAWVILVLWTILHWVRLPSGADSSLLPEKTLQRYGNDAFVIQRDVMNYQVSLSLSLSISPFGILFIPFGRMRVWRRKKKEKKKI
jgi:hypothetical protein